MIFPNKLPHCLQPLKCGLRLLLLTMFWVLSLNAAPLPLAKPLIQLGLQPSVSSCSMFAPLPRSPYAKKLTLTAAQLNLDLGGHLQACMTDAKVNWHHFLILGRKFCATRSNQGNIQSIKAQGQLKLTHPKFALVAPSMHMVSAAPDQYQMSIDQPTFRLQAEQPWWGYAKHISVHSDEVVVVDDAEFSKCADPNPAWALYSQQVRIDHAQQQVYFHQPQFQVRDWFAIPLPSFGYPLTKTGKTGLLMPHYHANNYLGWQLQVPWYVYLATNQDFKFDLNYATRAGVSLAVRARWLSAYGLMKFYSFSAFKDHRWAAFRDNLLANPVWPLSESEVAALNAVGPKRYGWQFKFESQSHEPWRLAIDWSHLSDDYLFRHYQPLALEVVNQHMQRYAEFIWQTSAWQAKIDINRPKTLLLADEATRPKPVYAWLPRISLTGLLPLAENVWLNWRSQTTRFQLFDQGESDLRTTKATRLVVAPKISWLKYGVAGSLSAEAGLHAVLTEAEGQDVETAQAVVPWFTIKRAWFWQYSNFGAQQTVATKQQGSGHSLGHAIWSVRPELMFHVAPRVDQAALPVLDTDNVDLSTFSAADPRRFVGDDRYGDAHDVTLTIHQQWQVDPRSEPSVLLDFSKRFNVGAAHHVCLVENCAQSNAVAMDDMIYAHFELRPKPHVNLNVLGYFRATEKSWPWHKERLYLRFKSLQLSMAHEHYDTQVMQESVGTQIWTLSLQHLLNPTWAWRLKAQFIDPKDRNNRNIAFELKQQKCCWEWGVKIASSYQRSQVGQTFVRDNQLGLRVALTGLGSLAKI